MSGWMWTQCGANMRPMWDQSKTNERSCQEDWPSPTTEPPYQLQAGLIGTEMHEGPASQPSRGHHLAQWPASRTNHGNYDSLSDMLPCAAFPFANTLEGWELLWQWKTCEKSYFLGGCLATLEHPCLLLHTCVCRLHQWSCKLQSSSHVGIINLEHACSNQQKLFVYSLAWNSHSIWACQHDSWRSWSIQKFIASYDMLHCSWYFSLVWRLTSFLE